MSQSLSSFLKTTLTTCALVMSVTAFAQQTEEQSDKDDDVERITVEGQNGEVKKQFSLTNISPTFPAGQHQVYEKIVYVLSPHEPLPLIRRLQVLSNAPNVDH